MVYKKKSTYTNTKSSQRRGKETNKSGAKNRMYQRQERAIRNNNEEIKTPTRLNTFEPTRQRLPATNLYCPRDPDPRSTRDTNVGGLELTLELNLMHPRTLYPT